MMAAAIARLWDGIGGVPRAVRAVLWIGCALAVLCALTLLTEGRSGGKWTSPARGLEAAVAPAEAPATAWTDVSAAVTPEPPPSIATKTGRSEAQEADSQAVAEPGSPAPIAEGAKRQNRGIQARRSARRGTRQARDPIQYRLADRPGL